MVVVRTVTQYIEKLTVICTQQSIEFMQIENVICKTIKIVIFRAFFLCNQVIHLNLIKHYFHFII